MIKLKICLFILLLFSISLSSCTTSFSKSSDVDKDGNCVITIAISGNSNAIIYEKINQFNSENNGYKIECKSYDEFYDSKKDNELGSTFESFSEIDNQIFLDIIKGEDIDIIVDFAFNDKGRFNELIKKGVFTDLYYFMESDKSFYKENLFSNILTLSEMNDKLMTIPLFFTVDTVYGESKYVGQKENWNLEQMIDNWNLMPENSTFNGKNTKDSVYREILMPNLTSFFDIEKGVCNFNSSEFLKELNFINSFKTPEEYKEPDYSVPNFIDQINIKSFQQYHDLFYDEYQQKKDCTFVGYPSNDMKGALICPIGRVGISANSTPNKQNGAWLFIKQLLEYDYQYEWGKYYFPINCNAFSQLGKDNYSKSQNEYTYTIRGQEFVGSYLTYDEYCSFFDYINNIKKFDIDINKEIINIINEEINFMIWDEKSPEETSKNIQERVEILVSEKY